MFMAEGLWRVGFLCTFQEFWALSSLDEIPVQAFSSTQVYLDGKIPTGAQRRSARTEPDLRSRFHLTWH